MRRSLFLLVMCVGACGQAAPDVPPDPDSNIHNVAVGDLIVHAWKAAPAIPSGSRAQSLEILPGKDPRFHYAKSLEGVFLYIREIGPRSILTTTYEERLKDVAPNPVRYRAPDSMKVFEVPPGIAVIRVDGTEFFGHTAYVECHSPPTLPSGPADGRRGYACRISAPLTAKTMLAVDFVDDRAPPEQWRDLLTAIEADIREITSPM